MRLLLVEDDHMIGQALHQGLSDEQSAQVNAKLILILSNHIGDLSVLREAMSLARSGIAES